jgi:outer membrane protein OmpA-like peptidoglycan-associated protein
MRTVLASIIIVAAAVPALAQSYQIQQPKGTWQVPGEIKQPKGNWQVPGEIKQPKGNWQVPGAIQQPKSTMQQPGEIQQPKGIEAVQVRVVPTNRCEQRLSVVGDALFDFDKSSLRPEAEETLAAAGPEIAKLGGKPTRIEGHTDAIGSHAPEALRGACDDGARMAGRARAGAGRNADQGLRQDQAGGAQHHRRRPRRSGRPAEEPARRGGVRYVHVNRGVTISTSSVVAPMCAGAAH